MSHKQALIDEILTRGVENIYPNPQALEQALKSGKKLTLYCGYDPNSPTLHIGHGITVRKLAKFLALGHKVIFLFGDFTGQIGDPDKLSVREQITHQQVLKNLAGWKKQIKNLIDIDKVEFRFNSKWLAKLNFANLIDIAKHFTVQQMLDRDMFQERLKINRPIYLHEFFYPLMQAYDSVEMNVDLEVGGNDQTFNMLAGRTLMKAMTGKEKMVLTMKLLEDPTGKKMGKSEGNMITLADSPEEVYGKVMSWTDAMILPAFEILTDVPLTEMEQIKQELAAGQNPKIFKMQLAYQVVKIYHGQAAATDAEQNFKQVFEDGLRPDEMPVVKTKVRDIIDVLVATKLAASKSEARRLLAQGAVKVDGKKITDENYTIKNIGSDGVVIQKGKRHFAKII
ncbi:MAG: tyrosine--tRNA ligase [Candidatus Buchananbacteria bacterium]|nr:tyrosine--tRNA ligase [Candidatus Buchananbacteria bacterium]